MPDPINITQIPAPRVELIDPRTGLMSREWFRFFNNIYTIVGAELGIIQIPNGGTGLGTYPKDGQLLIGDTLNKKYVLNTLTAGSGIGVTNGAGTINVANTGVLSNVAGAGISVSSATGNVTIANTGVLSVTGTAPVVSSGGTTPAISLAANYGDTLNPYAAKTAHYVLAGPTAGAAAAPTFRALVATDIPALPYGTGDVVGPASATDNAVARFNTTTGKLIQNSVVIIDDTGNVSGVKSQTYTGVIPTSTPIGTMWFDAATDTLNFKQNNITQQVGEELFIYGRASEAITDGQVIAVTGAWGTTGVVTFEPAPIGTTNQSAIIGLATEPIAKNSFGRITTFGTVHDLNTASLGDGTVLWYDPTVVGGYTVTKPSAPNIKVQVGIVTKAAGGTNGSIAVNVISGSTLGDTDSNVQFSSLANNNLIQYNSSLGYWTNVTPASVLATASGAPVTKTANFTVANGETWFINNKSGSTCTVTLPTPSTNTGRTLTFKNMQAQTLVSASSNVVPLDSTSAGTAILLDVIGNWATLVSDGTNWVIMQAASNNNLLLE
jgi:hypothetical protein